jgi:hypothetical protein
VFFSFAFTLHLLACGYWGVVRLEWEREQNLQSEDRYASPSFNKWLPPAEKWSVTESTFAEQYIFAGHNVLLCMIGNDLQPYTIPEGIFSSVLMISGEYDPSAKCSH